jgi:outer membrane immunogenic protein
MRRLQCALLAAVAAVGFASIASAADMPVKARMAPVAVPFSWTGFYIGGNVGGAFSNAGQITELTPGPGQIAYDCTGCLMPLSRQTSFLGGLQIGYNYQINQFVLGVEADIDWLHYNVSAPEQTVAGVILTGGDVIGSKTMNWLGTVRGRLGWAYDRTLFYATGGAAFSDLKYQVVDACNTGGCGGGLTSGSTTQNVGWTAGGGIEYAFNRAWSVKAEYLYVSFAGKSFTTATSTPPVGAQTPWNADHTNLNIARVGVNYHFGM